MIQLLMLNKNWGAFLIGAGILIALDVARTSHWTIGAFVAWMLTSAIWYSTGTFQALALLACLGALLCLSVHSANLIEILFALLCMVSCVVTLVLTNYGLSGNPSMNGCLIAITLPFLIRVFYAVPPILPIGLAAAAILKTDASIPVGALFVSVGAMALSTRGIKSALRSMLVILPIGVIAYYLQPTQFFSSTGRFWFWGEIWKWFTDSGKLWLGHGTGALDIILRSKLATDPEYRTVIWAHNDYLQILFDNGILGLSLFLLAALFTLRQAFKNTAVFAALCAYLATALFNFPMHVPLHAFVGAALVWMAWVYEDHAYYSN